MKIDSSIISPDRLTQLKSYVYDIIGCCQDVHGSAGIFFVESADDEVRRCAYQRTDTTHAWGIA